MTKVNHVLSKNTYSGIFEDIFNYFEEFSYLTQVQHSFSVEPIPDSDIYHYHRPNLEKDILPNSFTTVHHDLQDTDSWLDINKFLIKYNKMDRIICLNESQRKTLNEYGVNNTIVIPWGYNSKIFTLDYKKNNEVINKDKKICLGIISKRYGRKVKGEALLYEIVKRLPSESFKFILVGEGRSQDAELLSSLGFETKVYEYLPYRMFNALYNEVDALLVTSFYEGGPANVPEAFSKGVPIISTPVGMAQDFIRSQSNGIILTKEPDIDSQEILKLLDKEHFKIVKENAIMMRDEMITWKEVVEKYNQEYLNYIKG